MLEALTAAINSLSASKGFKSFRFRYHSGNTEISSEYARAGLLFLNALYERPIDELEIDQLTLTSEDQVRALSAIILDSNLKNLTLTKLSPKVAAGVLYESFLLPIDTARTLKKIRISFKEKLNDKILKTFLRAMQVVPELSDLNMSNNYIGSVLGEKGESYCFKPLEDLIHGTQSLRQFDISQNELFTGNGTDEKFPLLDTLKAKSSLRVNIKQNGLSIEKEREFDPPVSGHYLIRKLENPERSLILQRFNGQ